MVWRGPGPGEELKIYAIMKGKDNALVPNGANVVNPASSSAPVKTKKLNEKDNEPPQPMPKKG